MLPILLHCLFLSLSLADPLPQDMGMFFFSPPPQPRRFLVQRPGLDYFSVTRRQNEQLPAHLQPVPEPEPSCAELRAMWRHMRRMARHSEITNEIPQIPDSYPYGFMSQLGHPKNAFYPDFMRAQTDPRLGGPAFGKIMRRPNKGKNLNWKGKNYNGKNKIRGGVPKAMGFHEFGDPQSSRKPVPVGGRFAELAVPGESLGLYGTMVWSPEQKAMLRRKNEHRLGAGRDTGVWGSIPARADVPRAIIVEPINSRRESSCEANLEKQPCRSDQDCYCSSKSYYCSAGRCTNASKKVISDQFGTWFNGPLDSSQLGIGPHQRNISWNPYI